MNIISASRRTDIPAFYSGWFMNRVREGRVKYANPFSGQEYEVSLRPEDVHSIVFWSKNPQPLEPHLPRLEAMGYEFIFHFTITGLPRPFEGSGTNAHRAQVTEHLGYRTGALSPVPPWQEAVKCFKRLSDRYGPKRVLWRFDPIILSDITGPDYFKKSFDNLARRLEGATERCYFSFVCLYPKVRRNLQRALETEDLYYYDPSYPERLSLVKEMVEIAGSYGITLYTCCDEALAVGGVRPAQCVDGELLYELFPDKPRQTKIVPTRKGCNCVQSRDIGAYDTCPHGCIYCYANLNHELACKRLDAHDPSSDMLLPS
ncbi:MAG TPA: DUF1848 domain-containing protein [Candidatus Tripitaka sp. YC43]